MRDWTNISHGEIQRVEEILELHDEGGLLVFALEREVDRRGEEDRAQRLVFQDDDAVAHSFNRDELLRRFFVWPVLSLGALFSTEGIMVYP